MSQIHRLLDVLIGAPEGELLIHADAPVTLVRETGRSSLTKQSLNADQWRGIVAQLVPPITLSQFDADGRADAPLTFGSHRLFVALSREAEVNRATVVHDPGPMSMAAAAEAVAALSLTRPPSVFPDALNLLNGLLRAQMVAGASDLHLRSGEVPLMRESGDIQPIPGTERIPADLLEAMITSAMPERNRREFAETNDTDYAYEIAAVGRFRMNAFRDRSGPGLVARAIPSRIVTADELGVSSHVRALCQLSKGLVLVTGPTGSGKSTTLCSLVDLVNESRRDHVITIEDPIEFVHESKGCLVTQREVGMHTGSFRHALRAALREDPDVVLVGELRDLDTVAIAIETAETGHLVFGTLHTSTAASTVDRVIDQFPPDRQEQVRVMLSESLRGVISQVLCRKIGGGRVAAMEILLVTPAVSNLIREGKTFQMQSIMQTSRKIGMVTMADALIALVESQQIEPREAWLKAPDKSAILQSLRVKGFDVSFVDSEGAPKGESAPSERPNGSRVSGNGRF